MPRVLTAEITAEKALTFTRPFPSAIFHFGGSVGDIALSSHDLTINGVAHQGCVSKWGEWQAMAQHIDGMFATGSMSMEIINKPLFGSPAKRFSDLFAGIGVEGVEVEVSQNWLKTDSPGTIYQAKLADGVMRVEEFTVEICKLKIAHISEKYLDAEVVDIINQTDYPNVLLAEIGKPANLVVGSAKNVPCPLVSTGYQTTIRATIGTGDTTVPIHDNYYDYLVAKSITSGTVQCGNEKIAWTSKSGSAGARVLGNVTRGSGGTPIESHNKNDTLIEVVSSWIFLAAGRASKAISQVYLRVGDKKIPLASSQYTVNLANTTLVSGKTLTTITFTAPPVLSEKDYVALGATEAQWEDIGSDQSVVLDPPNSWANNAEVVSAVLSINSQSKTKVSGNFNKRLSVGRSGGEAGNYNTYLENVSDGIFTRQLLINGQTVVCATPVLRSESNNFWNLRLIYKNESGNTLAQPVSLTVQISTKSVTYAIAGPALSATSTADNPIGDIYCDMDGVADDGSGTYTGSANALIEKPADVFHWLARVAGAIPAGRVDAQSFIDARTEMNSAVSSYKISGVVSERATKLKEIYLALAEQTRLKVQWPVDKLTCRFIKSTYGAAIKTIAREDIRALTSLNGLKTTLRLSRSPVEELINKIDLRYGRDWSMARGKDAYEKVSSGSDSTSITKYGTRERPQWFFYDFVAADNSTMADDLRAFWLSWRKEPARRAEYEAFLKDFELLPGDVVALKYLLADGSYFDGLDGNNKFLIEDARLALNAPAQARAPIMRFSLREVA